MAGMPDDTVIDLPDGPWQSALTDTVIEGGPQPFAVLRDGFPVAVLHRPDAPDAPEAPNAL
jgi:hypothetical protein